MTKSFYLTIIFVLISVQLRASDFKADTIRLNTFGKVLIYKPQKPIESVVLFISGDGGWNAGVIEMAKSISGLNALIVGIDIRTYFKKSANSKSNCLYPAGELENLSFIIQKKYGIGQYLHPVLIGYSSGATLVYGALAQAPTGTFKGAISLGFCPDIECAKPLCKGSGLFYHEIKNPKGYYIEASDRLEEPFIVLQGKNDQVCGYEPTYTYMHKVRNGQLITLPTVGHGFSVQKNWWPQMKEAYLQIIEHKNPTLTANIKHTALPNASEEIPLIVMPSERNDTLPMALFISGDGGWTGFDNDIATEMVHHKIPVVALDAQKYFWKRKSPEETAATISSVISKYLAEYHRNKVILIGYSFGADIMPFVYTRLPESIKQKVETVNIVSGDPNADFEIHVMDMLSLGSKSDNYDVVSEIEKMKGAKIRCVFGEDESSDLKSLLKPGQVEIVTLPGSHHFNDDAKTVAATLMRPVK